MRWYDLFSTFYDHSMEDLYREARRAAAAALDLRPGEQVLDIPCGTGLSFDELAPAVGPEGRVVGVDRSAGMLARAEKRAQMHGWTMVTTREADATTLEAADLGGPPAGFDALHVFLGLTAFPDWEATFARLYGLVRPGGRVVLVDVHADPLGFQGRMVNLVARADIRRKVWTPLEAMAERFERTDLPSRRQHGGQLFLARGSKAPV